MKKVDKDSFTREVIESQGIVVVEFTSPSCAKCQEISPEVDELEKKYGDRAKFCSVDVSQNRRLAISQRVMGLPAIVVYVNGTRAADFARDFSVRDLEQALAEAVMRSGLRNPSHTS